MPPARRCTTSPPSSASASRRCRSGSATSTPHRHPAENGAHRRPHPAHEAKLRQIAECDAEGIDRIGSLSVEAFLAAGIALYAGEGAKRDGDVIFANTDDAMVRFFCRWLRRYFAVDESRLRFACISMRVWISTPRSVTGRR